MHFALHRKRLLPAIAVAGVLALAGCSAPGASGDQAAPEPVSTDLGSDPITVSVLVDTPGVAGVEALGAEFTKKYPNVTIKVTGQDFVSLIGNAPRLLASGDVPDIARVTIGSLVKDKLLTSLDGYATAYGWDSWPQTQFTPGRMNDAGTVRGEGSLYQVGNGFGLTGLYYNKAVLKQLGGTVPTTLDQLEALMKKAKDAGFTPMQIAGKTGSESFTLQNLVIDYGGVQPVNDWIYRKPGASIDTDAMVKAATTIQDWANAGYFPDGVNSIDDATSIASFFEGKSLFIPNGNWQAPNMQKNLGDDAGFMLFPSVKVGDTEYAMSASEGLVIPAKAKHKDAAAAFLNFIMSDESARQITVDQFGLAPAGPSSAKALTAPGVVGDTLTQFTKSLEGDGLVDFFANTTTSMPTTLTAQVQLLVANQTTPKDFATKVQSDYLSQLKG